MADARAQLQPELPEVPLFAIRLFARDLVTPVATEQNTDQLQEGFKLQVRG